jgi:hypothetical protein
LKGPNITGNYSARANQATLTQPDSASNRCIRSDRGPFFDPGIDRNPVGGTATRHQIVSEHCVWSKENVVGHVNVFPQANAILNRDVVTDADAVFDEGMIPDVAVAAYSHVLLYVSKRPDARGISYVGCFD